MTWKFIENRKCCLLGEIESLLHDASKACFAVAFVRTSGVNLIARAVQGATERGAAIRMLFGLDWALTEAAAIRAMIAVGVQTKYYSGPETFHPKGYLFEHGSESSAIIGSANLSASGLTSGREWSISFSSSELGQILGEFDRLWRSSNAQFVDEKVLRYLDGRKLTLNTRQLASKEDKLDSHRVPSISFQWGVEPSFRNYAVHPITVPKKQVKHDDLRSHGFDRGTFEVIFGNAAPLNGYMHSANQGSRQYYQLRMAGPAEHPLFALPDGFPIRVRLEGPPGAFRVIIAPADAPLEYNR
jgi:HKD family nuclease